MIGLVNLDFSHQRNQRHRVSAKLQGQLAFDLRQQDGRGVWHKRIISHSVNNTLKPICILGRSEHTIQIRKCKQKKRLETFVVDLRKYRLDNHIEKEKQRTRVRNELDCYSKVTIHMQVGVVITIQKVYQSGRHYLCYNRKTLHAKRSCICESTAILKSTEAQSVKTCEGNETHEFIPNRAVNETKSITNQILRVLTSLSFLYMSHAKVY